MNNTTSSPSSPLISHSEARAFLQAVAAALPGDWVASLADKYPRSDWEGDLIRADGLTLWLMAGGYGNAGRIKISHNRPRNDKGQYIELWGDVSKGEPAGQVATPSISVSMGKSPEKIAGDIAKRLLPDAEKVEQKAHERIELDRSYEKRRTTFLQSICDAAGVPVTTDREGVPHTSFSVYLTDSERDQYRPSVRVDVRSDCADFRIEARNAAQAAALVAFLRSPAYLSAS